jgi:AcrR family transcriptional regulator
VRNFSELGFHGTSMRKLAGDAGLTLSNVYNYFPSKTGILLEVLRRSVTDQIAITTAAVERAGDSLTDRLLAGFEAFVKYDIENIEVCFVANSELRYLDEQRREQIVAVRDEQQKLFENLIAEGVESGDFRTAYPDTATIAILTMFAGVTVWYRPDGPLGPDAVAKRYGRYAMTILVSA